MKIPPIPDKYLRESIWERFTNKNRIKSFQDSHDPAVPLLCKLLFDTWSEYDMQSRGKTKLYRIDTLEHVLSVIHERKLYLPHPTSWDDPWEDPVMRQLEKNVGRRFRTKEELGYDCFALCWTEIPSCEAHWRRLKDKGRLVRIGTDVQALLSSLRIPKKLDVSDIQKQVFLNPVFYLPQQQEQDFQKEVLHVLAKGGERIELDLARLASLYAKRESFSYEKEVRLVFRLPFPLSAKLKQCCKLDLNPKMLIQSLEIDPWCGKQEYKMIAGKLKRCGYPCAQSPLATPLIK